MLGYWARKKKVSVHIKQAEARAEKILKEARTKERDLLLKAQDKALKIIDEAKTEEKKRREQVNSLQERLEQRESVFSKRLLELQEKQQDLYDRVNRVEEAKEKIKQIKEEQLEKLNKIASMNKEEAREVLFKNVEVEAKEDLAARMRKLEAETDEKVEVKAQELIADSMQRVVSTYVPEISTTNVDLPNDEIKGRIIGREGRNIKVIEGSNGVFIAMPSRKIKQPCPKCGFRNEMRSKFCNQCGGQLPLAPRPLSSDQPQSSSAEHKDIAHPITQSFREYLQKRVLEAFEKEKSAPQGQV